MDYPCDGNANANSSIEEFEEEEEEDEEDEGDSWEQVPSARSSGSASHSRVPSPAELPTTWIQWVSESSTSIWS